MRKEMEKMKQMMQNKEEKMEKIIQMMQNQEEE